MATQVSYQQIHANKPLFGNQGKVLNLDHLDFDIVSDFDIRISDFASLGALHLSRVLYKSTLFMQNKPNFDKGQNKPNPLYKKDLRKFYTPSDSGKTNPIQTQTNPIC